MSTALSFLLTAKRNPNSSLSSLGRLLSLIKSCTGKHNLLQIYARLIRTTLVQNDEVFHQFLSRFASTDIRCSRRIFSQRENLSSFHYNTMIRAYSTGDVPQQGLLLFRELRQKGYPANPVSSSFAIKCCVKSGDLLGGTQIHGKIWREGFLSDSLLLTTLMDLYSVCEKGDEACQVFDELPLRDTVAWNVLISCYLRNRRTRDVLGLFDAMKDGVDGCEKPDDVTCLLVLQACANLGALEFGEKVHGYIDENLYGNAPNLCNSLISMYSRCGSLDKAYEVFKRMKDKNVVSWSAMISGLAKNGYGREAVDAFTEMQNMRVLPDEQTFTGVLSACSHCGFVEEGMMFFEQMSRKFGINPNIHHYGCMVDLLGRARLLDQAYCLIASMKIKPDPTIWRTLLGACRIHGHLELGERVIEHLIQLKAEEAGDYVLLSNIYSSAGNWEKVSKLRKIMIDKGIQTSPGCSTMELKGITHEFVVDDVSHPQIDEIYEMLKEINQQLKIAGYVAEITSELHNLGAEEKGYALSYHSEKLAIAFGILMTPPGTTIRVAKNLRSCVDCHNFAKFVSEVYNRVVIIRDRSRFHHFRAGRCSCNDYW